MSEAAARDIIGALWIAWLLYWLLAARDAKPTRWRESPVSEALHVVPLLFALLLLLAPRHLPAVLVARFIPAGDTVALIGVLMVAAGLGFAVWARWRLGRNWSSAVTLKHDHALIVTGPYRYVRHPIYSGILLGILGTAVAVGEWRGLAAAALTLLGFAYKSRVEEGRLGEIFPEYAQYRRRTAMIIPFIF